VPTRQWRNELYNCEVDPEVKGTVHHMEVVLPEGGSEGYQQWMVGRREEAGERVYCFNFLFCVGEVG